MARQLKARPAATEPGADADPGPVAAGEPDEAGQPGLILPAIEDITERERAAEALREARDGLEDRVRERTAALAAANNALRAEVAERRRAEEALRESEETLRLLVEGVEDYGIFMLGPEGHVASWNSGAEKINGYRADEIIGQHFSRFYPAGDVAAGKPDRELEVATAEGRVEDEGLRVRKDGSQFSANVVITALRDDAGQLRGFCKVTRDITERKRAEAAAQAAREYAESIVETVREPLVVLDADLRVVSAGQAFYDTFQVTPEQTQGQLLYELGERQWDIPRLRELLESILPNDRAFQGFEVELDFQTIGRKAMVLNARQVAREAGQSGLILLAIEDITERKRAEESLRQMVGDLRRAEKELRQSVAALERSNAELEQFAYVASHDLQEPLRMVGSYLQLLERRYKGQLDSDADDFIGYAVDGATRMKALINDLLTLSRVETRGEPFESTDCELALRSVLTNLKVAIEESGAEVTHGPLPTVTADESQLGQLFQNLIANAVKFRSEELPRVHVSAEERDGEWVFSVQDNGIGIDPQYADQIFGVFQRLHGKEEYAGTGIGLAVCKKIAERHAGHIWVESQEGHGATFYFTVPTRRS